MNTKKQKLLTQLNDLKKKLESRASTDTGRRITKAEINRNELLTTVDEISMSLADLKTPNLTQVALALRACRRAGAVTERLKPENLEMAKTNWSLRGLDISEKLDDAVERFQSENTPICAQSIANLLTNLISKRTYASSTGGTTFIQVRSEAPLTTKDVVELENFASSLNGLTTRDIAARLRDGRIDLGEAQAFFNLAMKEKENIPRSKELLSVASMKMAGAFQQIGHDAYPAQTLDRSEAEQATARVRTKALQDRLNTLTAIQKSAREEMETLDLSKIEKEYEATARAIRQWDQAGRSQGHRQYLELTTRIFKLGRLRRLAKGTRANFKKG